METNTSPMKSHEPVTHQEPVTEGHRGHRRAEATPHPSVSRGS